MTAFEALAEAPSPLRAELDVPVAQTRADFGAKVLCLPSRKRTDLLGNRSGFSAECKVTVVQHQI